MRAPRSSKASAQDAAAPFHAELEQLRTALAQEKTAREQLAHAMREVAGMERQRVAQTLHDTACQSLTGVCFAAKVMEKKVQKACPGVARDMSDLCAMLQNAARELQEVTKSLRRPEEDFPLDHG